MLTRLAALAALLPLALAAAKRPLTHADYASWKSIQTPTLSRDGRWLAYALFPQEGEGELVIREIASGREHREPVGAQPPAPDPDPDQEAPPARPSIRIAFTSDARFVVASVFPTRAEAKKKGKSGLAMVKLDGFTSVRAANVKSFQVPEKGGAWVAYLFEPAEKQTAAELVLRQLAREEETKLAGVGEYAFARDGATLVYANAAGVEALTPGSGEAAASLLKGKGKYTKLTWDRDEAQLAFLGERSLYHWPRRGPAAVMLAAPGTDGLPAGWVVSDRGTPAFSRDGKMLWFSTAPVAKAAPPPPADAGEEQVRADLWHWKDPIIQPMQKVRAAQERNRTYRAVVRLNSKQVRQIGDATLATVTPSDDGQWAAGADDRAYRSLIDHDAAYADHYLVDTNTGERTLVAERLRGGGPTWSPDGKHVLFFRDKDWHTASAPASVTYNLTRGLGMAFHNEQWDQPAPPSAYGSAGWTSDGRWVLLYDRYDVWQVAADGSQARRLTDGMGREKKTVLRVVRFDEDEAAPRGFDPAKPVLLSAADEVTRASGFWRDRLDREAPPEKLVMEDRAIRLLGKAKDADVVLTASSTFAEFPEVEATDSSFASRRKLTRANPQQADVLYGSAGLVRYRSVDGEPLQGILMKPEGFDPAKKYPLIVYIYERLTQTLHNYAIPQPGTSVNPAYYTSNGYLLLMPDISYRVGSPGQSALKCVLPAIQAVVDQGFVDEARIGIQGHSWGGYQIAYMITQTNRFRAAIAGAPVGNMTSAYNGIRWGTGLPRQFQYERVQSRIGGTLWTAPMKFLENSPVFMADRVQTPVLMIHNDEDDAVPWQQGIELFLSLRRNGKEAYLFNYNGEKHGPRKRHNQQDWTRRMQEYFDHFLKGVPAPKWMEQGIPYLEREQEKLSLSTDGK